MFQFSAFQLLLLKVDVGSAVVGDHVEKDGFAEARRIGLVHEVVPAAQLEAAGARVVGALLQNAPEANAQTKQLALEYAWGGFAGDAGEAAFERLVLQHAQKRQSAEAAEGLASFREKRAAAWYPGGD